MSRLDEPVYLGAYWGDRVESATACADRLARCLASMEAISQRMTGWRPKGRSRSEALLSASTRTSDLEALLEAGVNRRDADGSAIPELGFRWSAWNGDTALAVSVSVTCGAAAAGSGVLNSFVLKLPELATVGAGEIYDDAAGLLSGIVEAWDPEWAVVTSHELRERSGLGVDQPAVGWLTYLGPGRIVDGMGSAFGAGTLIRVSGHWEDVEVREVADLVAALDQAGALSPIGI